MQRTFFFFTDDGAYKVLEDSTITEMFKVMNERYPKFNELKAKEFIKRDPDAIIHGDFHSGNLMFGEGENEGSISHQIIVWQLSTEYLPRLIGEVVLFDFQTYGYGLACNEFTQFVF